MESIAPATRQDSRGRPDRRSAKRKAVLRRLLTFFVACAVAFVLEHYVDAAFTSGGANAGVAHSLFSVRNVYQSLVAAWPRHLVPRFTALVNIDPALDPTAAGLANNVCAQRRFLAQLLPAIAEREPAIIVIDKYFTRTGCLDEAPSAQLQQMMAQVSAHRPVVVGVRIAPAAAGHDQAGQGALAAIAPLQFASAAHLSQGIVNLDVDSRRIPLGWRVQLAPGEPSGWLNGLALEAANVYDRELWNKYPKLQALRRGQVNPYLSMIAPSDHVVFSAADLLCALPSLTGSLQQQCVGHRPEAKDPSYLRGRIVVVGEVSQDLDLHQTVIGNVQGMVLQANYIEALLDERYFSPAPKWVDYLVGFLLFAALEASLLIASALRAIGSAALVLVIAFVLLSLAVRYLGYYVSPVVSALAIAFALIGWVRERILKVAESHHEP